MMSAKNPLILAVALSLGLFSSAHATAIIMDAVSLTNNSANGLNNNAAAQSFVADSTGIGDVEMYLSEGGSTTTGSVVITIRTDNGNKPSGGIFYTIQTLTETQIPYNETLFDFYNIPVTSLISGSKYWIEVSKAGSSNIATYSYSIPVSNILTGTSSIDNLAGDTAYASGGGVGSTSKAMTLCVSDDNTCDVIHAALPLYSFNEAPEPASVGIIGIALAGLSFVRRRRVKV